MSVRYELRGEAAWVTLDRPERANAFDAETLGATTANVVSAEDEARVAVLTGAGDVFSAGGDLDAIASIDGLEDARSFVDALVDLFRAVETASVPVVAAVNGDAFGAGLELVVAADLAVAVEDARFGAPETRMGVQPPLMSERAAETAGRKRVAELALTSEPVGAETARDWGLVNRAVPEDDFDATVEEYADAVTETEPDAARLTKERIAGGSDDYEAIKERMADRLAAPETRERFRAAAEER